MKSQGKGKIIAALSLLALSMLLAIPVRAAGNVAAKVPMPRPSGVDPPALPGEVPAIRKSGRGETPREPLRNPFAITEKLARLADKPPASKASESDTLTFTPRSGALQLPKMRLRGHLHGQGDEAVALLEIEGGGVYIVREGDDVGLHEFGYDSVIRIQKIDRLHLVVESGTLGQLIIVR
jgi:hypothetical protein